MENNNVLNTANLFIKICKSGTFFFPAWKHYGNEPKQITCDRCARENIEASIGYDMNDLCLRCAEISIKNSMQKPLIRNVSIGNASIKNGPRQQQSPQQLQPSRQQFKQKDETINKAREYLQAWKHLGPKSFEQIWIDVLKRLQSKEFNTSPQQYMKNWARSRGTSEMFRIPEDPALDIISRLLIPEQIPINKLKRKSSQITPYLKAWEHLGDESLDLIENDVESRLKSKDFHYNPTLYVEQWAKDRGTSEELRIPEDASLEIIKKILLKSNAVNHSQTYQLER